jgi:hypothetical protein
MSKPTSNTAEQLRKLMNSHVENAAAKPEPVLKTAEAVTASQPAFQPAAKLVSPAPQPSPARYSLRLLAPEISKINSIIQETLEKTGERVTLTDVLRVGIGRVGESSPIARHEIVYLRKNDGRRTKAKG